MVVAPAGTTATWLNAGLATSPSGCKRLISMGSTVAVSPDRSDPVAQLQRQATKKSDLANGSSECHPTQHRHTSNTQERPASPVTSAKNVPDACAWEWKGSPR